MPPQRKFIERVRSTFLVDDELPEQIREGALNLQTQLNEALRLLSVELYSKKSHFVLELVQNADDNSYRTGVTPELTLRIEPDRLTLSNNETGFTEENILAICKVGASSKAKEKKAQIGEKGIGFKSVFSVSDAPEIHSNGYHFRFDRSNPANLLGYVIPSWCETPSEARPDQTTIILPAARGYSFNESTVAALDARILLFLNKLRQLTLIYGGRQHLYRRTDAQTVSQLTTSTAVTAGETRESELLYVRVAKTLPMTGAVSDSKRPGVNESTVILAFPVDAKGEAKPEPASYVFAYLPIQQVGFRFPLHADFLLNSGREAVLNDRPWNQRLRDGIAEAFELALDEFKKSDTLGLSYLKYVPDVTDIADDFFGEVRQGIVERLAAAESLLSASGKWHKPSDLRSADRGFRALFPPPQALSLFGFDYVDARVQGGSALLRELGVGNAGHEEVLNIFRFHQGWMAEQPLEWRASLFAHIADELAAFVRAGLLKVPCLPTADGKYVVPSQANVFFPLGKRKKYGFEHELTIVDSELYDAALALSANVKSLFEALRVRDDNPYDRLIAHILPKHAGETWKQSKFAALVGHLRYVKDKLSTILEEAAGRGKSQPQIFQMLREGMWIGTKLVSETGSWTFDRIGNLYLGNEYKPQFCIETLAGGEPGPSAYISADYLSAKAEDPDAEAKSWREFFEALGVRTSPALASVGTDWQCSKELDLLLNAASAATRRDTLECLSRHWPNYAARLIHVIGTGRGRFGHADTRFAHQIRSMPAPLRGKKAVVPLSEAYYLTEDLKATLGDGPPYVDAFMTPQMLDDCRVTHRLNAKALLKRLKQLKQDSAGTVKQVQAIYRKLEGPLWATDSAYIRQSFETDGLVQLKGAHKGWFSPSQISWQSNGSFLDTLYPPVQGLYRDFQGFFVDKLGVPRVLPLAKWVEALTRLDEIADRTMREAEALAIYKRAERALKPQFGREVDVPEWISTFTDEAVFVDHWGEVVANGDHLYANDSPEYGKLFEDEEALSFLAVPTAEVPRLSRLLVQCGIAMLSESVSVEVDVTDSGRVDKDLTSRVHRSVPYLARVVYSRQPESFEDALEAGRVTALWDLEVVEVDSVKLRVSLRDLERTTTSDSAMSDGRVLYRADAKSLKDRVAAELSKYLVGTIDFADTFARILLENDIEGIEEVLQVRSIGLLPPDLSRAVQQRALPTEAAVSDGVDESTYDGDTAGEPEDALPSEGIEARDEAPAHDAQSQRGSTSKAPDVPGEGDKSRLPPPTGAQTAPSPSPIPLGGAPRPSGPTPSPTGSPLTKPISSASPSGEARAAGVRAPSVPPAPGYLSGAPRTPAPSPNQSPVAGGTAPPSGESATPGRTPQGAPPRTRTGRLLSYVEGPADQAAGKPSDDPSKAKTRDATGRAAVSYFLKTQASRWASLTEMPHNNPGFDVLARTASGEEEYIEVKGQGGAWTQEGIALTPTELLTAQRMSERYWLCVVEFAQDEKRRQLHLLRNPFGLVNQFRFDVGWKAAAENVTTAPTVPEKGLYVDIANVGAGRILSVRGKGAFFHLHVILEDGKHLNKLFHPARMTLSKEPLWQE